MYIVTPHTVEIEPTPLLCQFYKACKNRESHATLALFDEFAGKVTQSAVCGVDERHLDWWGVLVYG
jgi:hypothetical protein